MGTQEHATYEIETQNRVIRVLMGTLRAQYVCFFVDLLCCKPEGLSGPHLNTVWRDFTFTQQGSHYGLYVFTST